MIFLLLILLTIAIALSMDTFSLALSLGTLNLPKKVHTLFPILVGIFHFVFPILGSIIGNKFLSIFMFSSQKLLGLIFLFLFLKLLFDLQKKEELNISVTKTSLIFLAISVSLDSFTTGIGLKAITPSYILPSLIFLIVSSVFTFLGLLIGQKANDSLGNIANYFGLAILLILALSHLFQ